MADVIEHRIEVPRSDTSTSLITHLERACIDHLGSDKVPLRFVVTSSLPTSYQCEVGAIGRDLLSGRDRITSIFEFRHRLTEQAQRFNVVLLVPTGVGAEIGGHSGDAGPVARMLAEVCDTLVLHPNVVNASDLNEMPMDALYVEEASSHGF